MQQAAATAGTRGGGARRVHNGGNLLLSTMVFLVALFVCMTALHPHYTHIFFSVRHRTPSLDYVESSLLGGFTPVTLNVGNRTGLVIPATDLRGARDIVAALTAFFALDVRLPASPSVPAEAAQGGEGVKLDGAAVTLSDVYAAVLLRGPVHSTVSHNSSSTRRPSVVHLCSALACVMPYVAQEWADRAALLWRLPNHTAAHTAAAVRPVANFALVFGGAAEAAAVLKELTEQRVLTAQQQSPPPRGSQSAMPLVGDGERMLGLEASCNALGQCRYRTPIQHGEVTKTLHHMSQEEPSSLSAVAEVDVEFWRRGNGRASHERWHRLAVKPMSSAVFNDVYQLDKIAIDLVHVDVPGADCVAAVAFLRSLVRPATAKSAPPPANILVTFYLSDWMLEMAEELGSVEQTLSYAAIPLHRSCLTAPCDSFSPRERWSFALLSECVKNLSQEHPPYLSERLRRSRAVQQPLCTVLLSHTFATQDALLAAAAAALPQTRANTTPAERFLYDSLGISPADEARLLAADVTTKPESVPSPRPSVVDIAKGVIAFVVQYIYFLVPITVGVVLTYNVCRRGGHR